MSKMNKPIKLALALTAVTVSACTPIQNLDLVAESLPIKPLYDMSLEGHIDVTSYRATTRPYISAPKVTHIDLVKPPRDNHD